MTDEKYESPLNAFMETYVPRDEVFEGVRKEALDLEKSKGVTRNLIPFIQTCVTKSGDFKLLSDIKMIYKRKHVNGIKTEEGTTIKPSQPMDVIRKIHDDVDEYFKFNTPHIVSGTYVS